MSLFLLTTPKRGHNCRPRSVLDFVDKAIAALQQAPLEFQNFAIHRLQIGLLNGETAQTWLSDIFHD